MPVGRHSRLSSLQAPPVSELGCYNEILGPLAGDRQGNRPRRLYQLDGYLRPFVGPLGPVPAPADIIGIPCQLPEIGKMISFVNALCQNFSPQNLDFRCEQTVDIFLHRC